jgi:hypothetical protein
LRAFARGQDLLREPATRSALPWRAVEITDGDMGRAAEELADWLEHTGGLWMASEGEGSAIELRRR